jgi:DNA polymerase
MPWRRASVDDRERYLRQQAELGGAEVVISRKATELVTAVVPAGTGRETRDEKRETPVALKATVRDVPSLKETQRMPAAKRPVAEQEVASHESRVATQDPRPATPTTKPIAAPGSWLKGAPPIPGPGLSFDPPATYPQFATLAAVAADIAECRKCGLCAGRTHTVPGEGDLAAKFVVVGEGPGANEDATGRPFVGRAGELLDDILKGIGFPRSSVFILNTVKCRPPENRKPLPDELEACLPYLHRQLAILRPKVILAAGSTAISALMHSKKSLGQLRGQVHRYAGIPVIATYHPAALLRNPNWKKPTWDDVRIARQLFDA